MLGTTNVKLVCESNVPDYFQISMIRIIMQEYYTHEINFSDHKTPFMSSD
jgi:hypothetical protein